MDFGGRIFVNFDSFDVWRIYSIALQAARDGGVRINVSWEEFLVEDVDPTGRIDGRTRALAACAAVREAYPEQHQRFVQAMLTLVYQEKDDPKQDMTLAVAARVAGLEGADVIARAIDPGVELLIATSAAARELGVRDVPTILDDGPALHVKTTGAAGHGSAAQRLDLINRMLHDDGIWSLTKP
jgi:predicted DsbA family dithiol-disulfide isomerase